MGLPLVSRASCFAEARDIAEITDRFRPRDFIGAREIELCYIMSSIAGGARNVDFAIVYHDVCVRILFMRYDACPRHPAP